GWMTHVLLTRSPLSPEPKPWFSLDLHVLSAPPAFVLSQDQTLREDWFALEAVKPAGQASSFELVLKVSLPRKGVTGYLELCDLESAHVSVVLLSRTSRASRRFTLLSFQRPRCLWCGVKKPPTYARRLSTKSECRIRLRPKASKLSRLQGLSYTALSGSGGMIAGLKRRGSA